MPPGLIDEINQTFDHGGRAASYLQAMNVTINREQSAFTMGDDATVATQDAALNAYTNAAVDELNAYQAGLQDIGAIISGTSCDGLIGAGDVQSFLDNVRTSGVAALPQQEIDLFSLFGVDPATSIPWTVNVNASRVPLSLSDALRGMATVVGQIVAGYGGGNAPLRRR